MKRHVKAAAAVIGLLVGCATLSPLPAQADPEPANRSGGHHGGHHGGQHGGGETSYQPPPIEWSPCTNGLQFLGGECGHLVVPLDYARPQGKKIKVAVSRLKHTSDEASYQGVMVVNLTWPGGSGLGQASVGKLLPEFVSGTYDWVGFDPRGVGASEPTLSCDPGINGYDRMAYEPSSPRHLAAQIKVAKDYSAACARTRSDLLRHATTAHTANDLDSLRKALGQEQLNYYGYVYGAYLGQVYGTMFPARVRRMVIDSAVDPRHAWFGYNLNQNYPLDQNLAAFSAWTAKHDSIYHLGTTEAAVRKKYYDTLAKLAKKPAGGVFGPAVWTDVFLLAYNTNHWQELATLFSAVVNTGDTALLKQVYDANYPTVTDNNQAMALATMCTDAPWPRDWDTWLRVTERDYRKVPFAAWADMWFVASCQSWSVPPQRPAAVGGPKTPSVLMVLDRTIDPSSTYEGSLAVRKLFPKAVLVESGPTPAETATPESCSPGRSIVEYLLNGTLPARVAGNTSDLKCPAAPLPNPAAPAAKSAAPPVAGFSGALAAATVR
uniref:alpha/beta fold hydrolase n=1 Tax=Herbidospora sakaeratensis TaxID=564415 RepID=UPI001471C8DC|nr:alpha/beta fold hydrolase [Herbidospora sakaeratensis]